MTKKEIIKIIAHEMNCMRDGMEKDKIKAKEFHRAYVVLNNLASQMGLNKTQLNDELIKDYNEYFVKHGN